MQAEELEPVESPCIGICTLDDSGMCVGCFRTRAEIGGWLGMSADQRRSVMDGLSERARNLFQDDR